MNPAYPDRVIFLVFSHSLEWMVVQFSIVTPILPNPSTLGGSRRILKHEIHKVETMKLVPRLYTQ